MKKRQKNNSNEDKKSQLEKEIEEHLTKEEDKKKKKVIEIEELRFEEFLEEPEFEAGSPSLNRVNISQDTPIHLEKNLAELPLSTNATEDNPLSYNPTAGKDEPKYQNYGASQVSEMLNREDVENLGRINPFARQEIGLRQSSESGIGETRNFERYDAVKRTDLNELGRTDERKDIKYKTLKGSL